MILVLKILVALGLVVVGWVLALSYSMLGVFGGNLNYKFYTAVLVYLGLIASYLFWLL